MDSDHPRAFRREIAPNHINTYANNVQMQRTFCDVQISFGQIIRADDIELITRDDVTIQMSPQLAVQFHQLLTRELLLYEQEYGEIPRLPGG